MMVRPLCSVLQLKAEMELFEKPNRIPCDIKAIKEWLAKQPHLQAVHPTDQWLIAFLRGNKYSLERSKEKLEMFYTLRTIVPELFGNRDPLDPHIQEILKLGVFLPLRTCKEENSCKACITRFGAFESSKYHLLDVMKIMFMIIEILLLEDDNFVVAGEFQLYGRNYDELFKVLPRSILPREYGGDDSSLQELTDYWKTKVESYRDWFLKEETECTNETLRSDKPKTTSVLFGVEGSFRKLEVD